MHTPSTASHTLDRVVQSSSKIMKGSYKNWIRILKRKRKVQVVNSLSSICKTGFCKKSEKGFWRREYETRIKIYPQFSAVCLF